MTDRNHNEKGGRIGAVSARQQMEYREMPKYWGVRLGLELISGLQMKIGAESCCVSVGLKTG
jgi:hypothetical protein